MKIAEVEVGTHSYAITDVVNIGYLLVIAANAEGESFWDSGNNSFLETPDGSFKTPLCEEDSAESGVAALSARMVLNFIFAPGNLFTGDFVYGRYDRNR